MQLIDTHAHLYSKEFAHDIENVLTRSITNNVTKIYMPNIDLTTIEPMLNLADCYKEYCFAMIGLHPCYVTEDYAQVLDHMEKWLKKRRFYGIGEIGMDLYRDETYEKEQELAFIRQLNWSRIYDLPLIIHCRPSIQSRSSYTKLIDILEKNQDGSLKGIFHCFNGTIEEANKIIKLGFF